MAATAKKTYTLSLGIAVLSLVVAIVSISTPKWTVLPNKTIGLWVLNDDGTEYSWTEQWAHHEDFFYANFMQACRGMMMAGVMIGGFGLLYQLYVMSRKQYSMTNGSFLLGYYLLASFLLISTAAVYSVMIPQPVCPGYSVCTNANTAEYLYTGNYGVSLWFCWIGGGMFLLPGAIAYEGSRLEFQARHKLDLTSKIERFQASLKK